MGASAPHCMPLHLACVALLLWCQWLRHATAEVLRLNFGPPDTHINGYEVAYREGAFVQWEIKTFYFGSCFGGYWSGGGSSGTNHSQVEPTVEGTQCSVAKGEYLCLIGLPVGSYILSVTSGHLEQSTYSCWHLVSGESVYNGTTVPGQFSTGNSIVQKLSIIENMCLRSCRSPSIINAWDVEKINCHHSCAFCTGTAENECTISCTNGRIYTPRDDGNYCVARPPYAPEQLVISDVKNVTLQLSWQEPVTGGLPIIGYSVLKSVGTEALENATFFEHVASTGNNQTSVLLTNLIGNTYYRLKVLAINALGAGNISASTWMVLTLPIVPVAPEAPEVEEVQQYAMLLNWSAPIYDGGSPVLSYILSVYDVSDDAPSNVPSTAIRDVALNETKYLVTDLLGFHLYAFKVRAVNDVGGSSYSFASPITRTLSVEPGSPSQPVISSLEQYAFLLSWTTPAFNGGEAVFAYRIECREGPGPNGAFSVMKERWNNTDAMPEVRIDGLVGYTQYACRVAGMNIIGLGAYSPVSSTARTLPVPPSIPGRPVAVEIQQHAIRLAWTAPTVEVGSAIIGYKIWSRQGDAQPFAVAVNNTGTTEISWLVTGLRGFTPHFFTVAGVNTIGIGEISLPSDEIWTAAVGPRRPNAPIVYNITASTMSLRWEEPGSGGNNITGYAVELDAGTGFNRLLNTTDLTSRLSGLLGSSPYGVRIIAYNEIGESVPSPATSVITNPPEVPDPPTNLQVNFPQPYLASLSWVPPEDEQGRPVTDYVISAAIEGGVFVDVAIVKHPGIDDLVQQLLGSSTYTFRVQAVNEVGRSEGVQVTAGTPSPIVPAVPGVPVVSDVQQYTVNLTWDLPVHDGGSRIVSFLVWAESEGQEVLVGNHTASAGNTTMVMDLVGYTGYRFRVQALNNVGLGPKSGASADIRTLEVPPFAPGRPSVADVTQHTLRLTWNPPVKDAGFPVTGYKVWQRTLTSDEWDVVTNDTEAADTELLVTDLEGYTGYVFSVAGINVLGVGKLSPESEPVTTLALPPARPKAPIAISVTASSMQLTWEAPPDRGSNISHYFVERSLGDGPFVRMLNTTELTAGFTGLMGSTAYRVRIVAANEVAESEPGLAAQVMTLPPVVPDPPTGLTLSIDAPYAVTLGWQPPADEGGRPLLGYHLSWALSSDGPYEDAVFVSVPDVTGHITRLLGSTDYVFRVQALNAVGRSIGATVTATMPPPVFPASPGVPLVSDIQQHSVQLTWEEPAHDGGARISSYVPWVSEAGGAWQQWPEVDGSLNTTVIDSLFGFTQYRFRVQAKNSVMAGPQSGISSSVRTLEVPPYAPGKPQASNIEQYQLRLSWSAPSRDAGFEVTGYRLWQQIEGTGAWTVVENDTQTNEVSLAVLSLRGNTPYRFYVKGINQLGVGLPSPISDTVQTLDVPPYPPVAPVISDITPSSMQLAWAAPDDGGSAILGYSVEISQGGGPFSAVVNTTGLAWNLTDLLGSTDYKARVIASNAIGSSGPGGVASATTLPPVAPDSPTFPLLNFLAAHTARVSWEPPLDHGGRPVSGYSISFVRAIDLTNGGSYQHAETLGAGERFLDIPQLVGSTDYHFQVQAINEVGYSIGAILSGQSPVPTVPAEPGVPAVSDVRQHSVVLAWNSPVHDGGSPLLGFSIWAQADGQWSFHGKYPGGDLNTTLVTGLIGDTMYRFEIQAENAVGLGSRSGTSSSIRTLEVPPFAPGKPVASEIQQYQLQLTWNPPLKNGGFDVVAYKIWMQAGANLQWFAVVNETDDNLTTWLVTGLQGNTPYRFQVAGINQLGVGLLSEASETANTLDVPPAAPSAPTLDNITRSSMDIAWEPEGDGGSPILGYLLQVAEGLGPFSILANTSGLSRHLPGLLGSTEYRIRLLAYNMWGQSEPGAIAVATTLTPTVPDPPELAQVNFLVAHTARVTWHPPADHGGRRVSGYSVSFASVGDISNGLAYQHAATVSADQFSLAVPELLGSTTYSFRVQAINAVGTSMAAIVTGTSPPPSVPAVVGTPVASDVEQHSLVLSWPLPAHDGGSRITGFLVWTNADGERSFYSRVTGEDLNTTLIDGLIGDTVYRFEVQAENAVGTGPLSAKSSAVRTKEVPPFAPGRPTAADAEQYQMRVHWSPPLKDGGFEVTGYKVWLRVGGSLTWEPWVNNTESSNASTTVTGLQGNTNYTFKVAGINLLGIGATSAPSNTLETLPVPPDAPDGLAVADITPSSLRLSWDAPADGGSIILGYKVELAKSSDTFSPVGNTTQLTKQLLGLLGATDYRMRVIAFNAMGESSPSAVTTALTLPPTPPQDPLNLQVLLTSPHTVHVTWDAPLDEGGRPITGYYVAYAVGGRRLGVFGRRVSGDSLSFALVDFVRAADSPVPVSQLLGSTVYTFRVQAANEIGTSAGVTKTITTDPAILPAEPGKPVVTSVEQHKVTLTWELPAHDGGSRITGFSISAHTASLNGGAWQRVAENIDANLNFTTISGLVGYTSYQFRVSATNAVGQGPESDASDAVRTLEVAPFAPGRPQTDDIGQYQIKLLWSAPSKDAGFPITGYQIWARAENSSSPDNSSSWEVLVHNTRSDATSSILTSLDGNTFYTFMVAGINILGVGEHSLESETVKTLPVPPDAPAAPEGSGITPSSAHISWQPPYDGGSRILGYVLALAQGAGSWSEVANTSSLTYHLSGLLGSTSYRLRLIAYNDIGASAPGQICYLLTMPPTLPEAPANIALSFDAPYIASVSWEPPTDNGGRPVVAYSVYFGSSGDSLVHAASVLTDAPRMVQIKQLLGSTEYTFQVQAISAVGASSAATVTDTSPPAVEPAAPGTPILSEVQQHSVMLSWSFPAHDGGSRIQRFLFWAEADDQWSIIGDYASLELNDTLLNETSVLQSVVPNLMGDTEYRFRVQAVNNVGASPESIPSLAIRTLKVPPFPPSRPRSASISQYQILLVWDAPVKDGGHEITGYKVWQQSSSSNGWVPVATDTSSNATTWLVTNLVGNTQYNFKVAGINALGVGQHSLHSETMKTLPVPPYAPTAPEILETTPSILVLSWTAPDDGGSSILGYVVKLAEGAGVFVSVGNTSSLMYNVTSLSGSTAYRVRVSAWNAVGQSPASPISSAVTSPPVVPQPPTELQVNFDAPHTASLSWAPPDNEGGRPVLSYTVSYSEAGEVYQQIASVAADVRLMQIFRLLGSTTYRFRVDAINTIGASNPAVILGTSPAPILAAAPGMPVASDVQQYSVMLAWAIPPNDGGSPIFSYVISAEMDMGNSWQAIAQVNGSDSNMTLVPNLAGNTMYRFRVQAMNDVGNGAESDPSHPVFTLRVPPHAPKWLLAVDIQQYQLTLTWDSPNDGGFEISGYRVWMRSGADSALSVLVSATGDNATSLLVTNLQGNTEYGFVVAGINALGVGDSSSPIYAVKTLPIPPGVPGAPLVRSVGPSWLQLEWSQPDDGGSEILGYRLEVSQESNEFVPVVNTTSLIHTLTDLLGLTSYRVRVIAFNAVGESDPSLPSISQTLPPTVPDPPVNLNIDFTAPYLARITWKPPPDSGGRPILAYSVFFAKAGHAFEHIGNISLLGAPVDLSLEVPDLLGSTAYSAKVLATNEVGTSAPAVLTATSPAPIVPAAPGVPEVSNLRQFSVVLSWELPEHNGGSGVIGFKIWAEAEADANGTWFVALELGGSDLNTTTVSDLTGYTAYRFQVQAVNVVGAGAKSGISNAVRTLPVPPFAPGMPNATDVQQYTLRLVWSAPSKDSGYAVTDYRVQYRSIDSSNWEVLNTNSASTTYVLNGLNGNTVYLFSVAGINALGVGSWSSVGQQLTAPLPPSAPERPSVLAMGDVWATLSWGSPADDGGSPVMDYKVAVQTGGLGPFEPRDFAPADDNSSTLRTVPDIMGNTIYSFKVQAINSAGSSPWSPASTPNRTSQVIPSPPQNVTVTGSVPWLMTVRWVEPASDGGAAISAYSISIAGPGESLQQVATVGGEELSWVVRSLYADTTYRFCVKARNFVGWSGCVEKTILTGEGAVPGPPETPVVSEIGQHSVRLTWGLPAWHGGAPVLRYSIWTQQAGFWSHWVNTSSADITTMITGLTGNTLYRFSVQAVNKVGTGQPSANSELIRTLPVPPPAPLAAPELAAPDPLKNEIQVSWEQPHKTGGSAITGYNISCAAGDESVAFLHAAYVAAPLQQVLLKDLLGNTTYRCRFVAINALGSSPPSPDSDPLLSPAGRPTAPGKPVVASVSNDRVEMSVTWTPPVNDGGSPLTGYQVWKRAKYPSGMWEMVAESTASVDRSYVFTGLSLGTLYTFRVAAVNAFGVGPVSQESDGEYTSPVVPSAPAAPTLSAKGSHWLEVEWTPPVFDGGSALLGYVLEMQTPGEQRRLSTYAPLDVQLGPQNTSFNVTDLASTTQYGFIVRAKNAEGLSEASEPLLAWTDSEDGEPGGKSTTTMYVDSQFTTTTTTAASVPPSPITLPTLGLPDPSKNEILLSWDKPNETGGSPIIGYNVSCAADGGAFEHMAFVEAPTLQVLITDLLGNVTYQCQVAAINAVGQGPPGPASDPVLVLVGKSSAPGKPVVTSLVGTAMTVVWTPPDNNGGSEITGYQLWSKAKYPAGPWVKVTDNTGTLATEFVFENLALATLYTFRVAAVNSFGAGAYSEQANGVYTSTLKPSAPAAPTLNSTGVEWLEVAWKPPAFDGGEPVLGYVLEMQASGGDFETLGVQLSAEDLHQNITGLTSATRYGVRVRARNAKGISDPSAVLFAWTLDENGNPASTTTTSTTTIFVPTIPPSPITLPTLGLPDPSKNEILVSWDKPSETGGSPITGYNVSCAADGGAFEHKAFVEAPTLQVLITDLLGNVTYQCRVSAINDVGQGPPGPASDPVLVLVGRSSAPGKPVVTSLVGTAMTVVWTPPDNNGGSEITGYQLWSKAKYPAGPWVKVAVNTGTVATEFVFENLALATLYTFRVAAVNSFGAGAFSEEADGRYTSTLKPSAPDAPSLSAAGIEWLEVAWKPPAFDGGEPVLEYVLEMQASGGDFESLGVQLSAEDLQHNITGLTSATRYGVRVRARNAKGISDPSAVLFAWTLDENGNQASTTTSTTTTAGEPTSPPPPVTQPILLLQDPTKNEILFRWEKPNASGGSPITGYNVSCAAGEDAPYEHMVYVEAPALQALIKDLLGNISYQCRVAAINDVGQGPPGPASDPVLVLVGRPSAPGKPAVTSLVGTSMTVVWTPPYNSGGSEITGYQLWSKAKYPAGPWVKVTDNTGTVATEFVFENLALATLYTFRVAAVNSFGAGTFSEEADGRYTSTLKPSAPAAPVLDAAGIDWLEVTWKPPLYDGGEPVLGYVLEMQASGGGFETLEVQLSAEDLNHNITGLTSATSYGIRVRARNSNGISGPSPILFAWTLDANGQQVTTTTTTTTATATTTTTTTTATTTTTTTTVTSTTTTFTTTSTGLEGSPPAPTTKPGLVLLNSSLNELTITWEEPSDIEEYNLTGYNISCAVGDEGEYHAAYVQAPASQATITNLFGNVTYRCRVAFVNEKGQGPPGPASDPVYVAVGRAASPGKPIIISKSVSGTSMTVTWTPPDNDGGNDIVGYQLWSKSLYPARTWEKVIDNTGSTATDFVFSNLFLATLYTFKVAAVNGFGVGALSEEADGWYTSFTVPSPPLALALLNAGSQWLEFAWDPPTYNGGTPIFGYEVGILSGNVSVLDVSLAGTSTSLKVSNLESGSQYVIHVTARNSQGLGDPSLPLIIWTETTTTTSTTTTSTTTTTTSTTTTANSNQVWWRLFPGAPGAPYAIAMTENSVTLAWAPPAQEGKSPIKGYRIWGKNLLISAPLQVVVGDTNSNQTTAIVSGLKVGAAYAFRLQAINSYGAGEVSPLSETVILHVLEAFNASRGNSSSDLNDSMGDSSSSGGGDTSPGGAGVQLCSSPSSLNATLSTDCFDPPVLTWQRPICQPLLRYHAWVQRDGFGPFQQSATKVPGGNATSWVMDGLQINDTWVSFRLQAVGVAGPGILSAPTSLVIATCPSAPPPSVLELRPGRPQLGALIGGKHLVITWEGVADSPTQPLGYRLLRRIGLWEGTEGFEVDGATTASHTAVSRDLEAGGRYEFAVQALWPGGVWGKLSEVSLPFVPSTLQQPCATDCGCSASCAGPCLTAGDLALVTGKLPPQCVNIDDGCPAGLSLDSSSSLCVETCPPELPFTLNISGEPATCLAECPRHAVADSFSCVADCSNPEDVLVLQQNRSFLTCTFANVSFPRVELTFDLDYNNPPSELAIRVLTGVAAAVDEPLHRFGVAGITEGSIIVDLVVFRLGSEPMSVPQEVARRLLELWQTKSPKLLDQDDNVFSTLKNVEATSGVPPCLDEDCTGFQEPPAPPAPLGVNSLTAVASAVVPLAIVSAAMLAAAWWWRRTGHSFPHLSEFGKGKKNKLDQPESAWTEDDENSDRLPAGFGGLNPRLKQGPGRRPLAEVQLESTPEEIVDIVPSPASGSGKPPLPPYPKTWFDAIRRRSFPKPPEPLSLDTPSKISSADELTRDIGRMTSTELTELEEGPHTPEHMRDRLPSRQTALREEEDSLPGALPGTPPSEELTSDLQPLASSWPPCAPPEVDEEEESLPGAMLSRSASQTSLGTMPEAPLEPLPKPEALEAEFEEPVPRAPPEPGEDIDSLPVSRATSEASLGTMPEAPEEPEAPGLGTPSKAEREPPEDTPLKGLRPGSEKEDDLSFFNLDVGGGAKQDIAAEPAAHDAGFAQTLPEPAPEPRLATSLQDPTQKWTEDRVDEMLHSEFDKTVGEPAEEFEEDDEDLDEELLLEAELAELMAEGPCPEVAVPPARGHAPWVLETWKPFVGASDSEGGSSSRSYTQVALRQEETPQLVS